MTKTQNWMTKTLSELDEVDSWQTNWNILEDNIIYWNILEYIGIYWNILEYVGIYHWNTCFWWNWKDP